MNGYDFAVALLCVTETEMEQVMKLYSWQSRKFEGDTQEYFESFFARGEKTYGIVAVQQDEMGMTAAATLSMKIIDRYRPRYLIMPGIAAGVVLPEVEEQMYGDVVLADVVWNYSAGKFVSPEKADIRFGDIGFVPRPTVVRMQEWLLPYIRAAVASPENETHVYVGPLASGSAVVANQEVLNRQIRHSFHNTAGLDMEGYAVMYAAEHATVPRPVPIVAKSVCDYADNRKSDMYQKFASFTSCQFVRLLYERYLPLEGEAFGGAETES